MLTSWMLAVLMAGSPAHSASDPALPSCTTLFGDKATAQEVRAFVEEGGDPNSQCALPHSATDNALYFTGLVTSAVIFPLLPLYLLATKDRAKDRQVSLLLLALSTGSEPAVDYLLDQGADFVQAPKGGVSELRLATTADLDLHRPHWTKKLLQGRALPDAALCPKAIQDALLDEPDLQSFLMDRGMPPMGTDCQGRTWLHRAAATGDEKTLDRLLKDGEVPVDARDDDGAGAIQLAAHARHWRTVDRLADAGVGLAGSQGASGTLLHPAALHGRTALVTRVIGSGVDLDAADETGARAVHLAASQGHWQMVELLAEAGAKLDGAGGAQGGLALMAAQQDLPERLRWLIEHGLDLNTRDQRGHRPIFRAAMESHWGAVRLLHAFGAELERAGGKDGSLLHLAVKQDRAAELVFLLDQGLNTSAVDRFGQTPLHRAAQHKNTALARLLIDGGARLGADTPDIVVQAVVERGDPVLAELLLSRGLPPNASLTWGRTPLDLCWERQDLRMAELLVAHGAQPRADTRRHGPAKEEDTVLLGALRTGAQPWITLLAPVASRDSLERHFAHAARDNDKVLQEALRDLGARGDRLLPAAVQARDEAQVLALRSAGARFSEDALTTLVPSTRGTMTRRSSLAPQVDLDWIRVALDEGAHIAGAPGIRETPIERAIALKHPQLVKLLVSRGASIPTDAVDDALRMRDLDWLDTLLSEGGQPSTRAVSRSLSFPTPEKLGLLLKHLELSLKELQAMRGQVSWFWNARCHRILSGAVRHKRRQMRGETVTPPEDADAHSMPASPPTGATGKVGMEWVHIPGGSFRMGSNSGGADEKPLHMVTITSFELMKTEVTFGQYKQCVSAGACTPAHTADASCYIYDGSTTQRGNLPTSFLGDDQPAVCVDWKQAQAFASWAGGRLPTEAEWEYAAHSGGKMRYYPWGDDKATCSLAILSEGGKGCGRGHTWPVCSKPAGNSEQGVCDLAGNVREWVQDVYQRSYIGAPDDGTAMESGDSVRVNRGGSWASSASFLLPSGRFGNDPSYRNYSLGFRLAR